jgi:hypothetical protein
VATNEVRKQLPLRKSHDAHREIDGPSIFAILPPVGPHFTRIIAAFTGAINFDVGPSGYG